MKLLSWKARPALVAPGMKGKVLSLHDGFNLDVAQVAPIPPKAIVQFETGMALMVDARMRWEKATEPLTSFPTARSAEAPHWL